MQAIPAEGRSDSTPKSHHTGQLLRETPPSPSPTPTPWHFLFSLLGSRGFGDWESVLALGKVGKDSKV